MLNLITELEVAAAQRVRANAVTSNLAIARTQSADCGACRRRPLGEILRAMGEETFYKELAAVCAHREHKKGKVYLPVSRLPYVPGLQWSSEPNRASDEVVGAGQCFTELVDPRWGGAATAAGGGADARRATVELDLQDPELARSLQPQQSVTDPSLRPAGAPEAWCTSSDD